MIQICYTETCEYFKEANGNHCDRWRQRAHLFCGMFSSLTSKPYSGATVPCSDGLESLVKNWEKELKKYADIIKEEANKANHDGVRAFTAMRKELKYRLKELRQRL